MRYIDIRNISEDSSIFGLIGLFGLAIATGLIVALGGKLGAMFVAFLLLGVFFAVIVKARPFISLCVFVLVIVNPLLIGERLSIPLPGLNDDLELREILLLIILGFAVVKSFQRRWSFKQVSLLIPAILFSGLVIFSIPISIMRGIQASAVLSEAFPWSLYVFLPLAFAVLITNEKELKIVLIVYLMSALFGSILAFSQGFVGPDRILIGARQLKVFHGSVRVYTESEAQNLISFAVFTALLLKANKPIHRVLYLVACLVIAMGMFVAISRTMIVAQVLVLVMIFWWVGRRRFLQSAFVLVSVIILLILVVSSVQLSETASIFDTFSGWFVIIFTPGGQESMSVVGRVTQYRIAIQQIAHHPLWGVGLGKSVFSEVDLGIQKAVASDLHNGFLEIALKLGITGLLLFLAWIVAGLKDIYYFGQISGDQWKAVSKGLFIGIGMIWVVSSVVTWVVSAPTLAQIGSAIGIAEAYIVLKTTHRL